jgi:hypothetical protein
VQPVRILKSYRRHPLPKLHFLSDSFFRKIIISAKNVRMDIAHPTAKTANAPVKLVKDNRTSGFFSFLF